MNVFKGTITTPGGNGSQAITGVGFQPKALILWLTDATATGYQAGAVLGFGFAVSSSQRVAFGMYADDNVNPPHTERQSKDYAISFWRQSTKLNEADLVSMDSDGFTLNWTQIVIPSALVHYLALGGSEITNAFVGRSTPASGIPVSTSITGVGFQPDMVFLLHQFNGGTFPLIGSGAELSLGAMAAPGQGAGSTAFKDRFNTAPTLVGQWQKAVPSVSLQSSTDATQNEADTTWSMDPDGFTMNWVSRLNNDHLCYLCLKGGGYWVGQDTQKTSTGTKAKTGIGFRPQGLFTFGANAVANASPDYTQGNFVVGASDGTNEGCTWFSDTDNVSTSDANSAFLTTKVIRHAINPSTTQAEADMQSFDADGYTLNWTTADAVAREFNVVAFGPFVEEPQLIELRSRKRLRFS